MNISELKDLATALALTASVADGVLSDGKVDFKDLASAPALFSALRAYTEVEWSQVLPQASDLDDAERAELADHFKAVFNLSNDSVEATVERGLDMVMVGVGLIMQVKDWAARLRKPA